MTPATAPVAAGGPADLALAESDVAYAVLKDVRLRYREASPSLGSTYRMVFSPARLTAAIAQTDEGFVAESPELGSIGYGADPAAALSDLRNAIRDYLSVLVEKGLSLAPSVAHHARYVDLLNAPEGSWFAAITAPTSRPADAA